MNSNMPELGKQTLNLMRRCDKMVREDNIGVCQRFIDGTFAWTNKIFALYNESSNDEIDTHIKYHPHSIESGEGRNIVAYARLQMGCDANDSVQIEINRDVYKYATSVGGNENSLFAISKWGIAYYEYTESDPELRMTYCEQEYPEMGDRTIVTCANYLKLLKPTIVRYRKGLAHTIFEIADFKPPCIRQYFTHGVQNMYAPNHFPQISGSHPLLRTA